MTGRFACALTDQRWQLVWSRGNEADDSAHEIVAVDPAELAALRLNRDLREAPGAPAPDDKLVTARRIADGEIRLDRLRTATAAEAASRRAADREKR